MKNIGKAFILSSAIIIGSASLPITPLSLVTAAEASSVIKISKTSFQTTSNLNMRSGAGTNYKMLFTIPKGKIVTATEKKSNWYKVSYTYKAGGKTITKTGWVTGTYLKEYYQYTKISTSYYFTKKSTKLYFTPDTKKKEAYSVSSNNGFFTTQKVKNSIGQTWYRISFKGKYYYVHESYINKVSFTSFKETKYQSIKDTALYQSYGNAHTKLLSIPKGSTVTSSKRIGDWYKVTFNGKSGYVNIKDFSEYTEPAAVTYQKIDIAETILFTNSSGKLYSTADNLKPEVATVEANNGFASTQKVENSLEQTWYRVSFEGKTLYLNKNDVSAKSMESIAPTYFKANTDARLYESYGNAYKALATVPKDTVIQTSKRIGDWYSVSFNGTNGYVNIKDFQVQSDVTEEKITDTTYITMAALTLRKTPDETGTSLSDIPSSKILVATHKTSNGWYKVNYGGKIGYVLVSALKQVKTGDPLTNRDNYQFIDLRTKAPITAQQINDYFAEYVKVNNKTSVLLGTGEAFINAANKYGVNALYLVAHAIHESGYGTSAISLGKNNLFGFGSYDSSPYVSSYRFNNIEFGIEFIAREMKATYLNPSNWKFNGAYLGFQTQDMNGKRIAANSEGMNFYYASDVKWGTKIANHMQKILPYDKAYYSKATVNTSVPALPSRPDGSDIFPQDIQAVANKDLVLHSSKGANDAVKTLVKGTSFTLLEKTNDFWVKVKVDEKIYWTNSIRFDVYTEYMSVKNLGRTTSAELNFRKEPSTSAAVLAQLDLNVYLHLILKEDGSLTMDSTNKWYKVKLADGKIGWVSSSYVQRELK